MTNSLDTQPVRETKSPTVDLAPQPIRILVVEDEALTVLGLRAQLGSLGYEVVDAVPSGEAAIRKVARLRPDLVLMDIHLQGAMDGTEAADRIHRRYHVPVVYLSGQSSEEVLERAKVTDAYGFILKPYDGRALKVAVEMALSKHRTDRAREAVDEELLALATTDSLTGLKNRRAFEEALDTEFARCRRYGKPLSLLMIDIDHFKRVNDTYGHLAGDTVLHRVAEIIQREGRSSDVVARFGGEEFAVLLIHADGDTALPIAERLRCAIEQEDWQEQRVTVTIGVSSFVQTMNQATDLVATADAALYEGKSQGRNRVVLGSAS